MRSAPPRTETARFDYPSLCLPFVKELGVTGASISVSGLEGRQSTVCVSGPLAARVDALQFELGEGPRWQAFASRTAVVHPALADVSRSAWPIFLGEALGLGVKAIFSFPMLLGSALVGTVDLCCSFPRLGDDDFVSRASSMTGGVAKAAIQQALASAENHRSTESERSPALRREVHQATGMIISQLGITATDAFSRLQGHAFASGKSIDDVARDVVARDLIFLSTPE